MRSGYFLAALIAFALILLGMAGIASVASAPRGVPLATALVQEPRSLSLKATAIPRIVCFMKTDANGDTWFSAGTGVWVGKNIAITADHVVAHAISCSIEGEKATIVREYGALDYAVVSAVNRGGVIAPISCDGIVAGRVYRATGYADGETYTRIAIWIGLAGRVDDPTFHFNGLSRFDGLAIGGMSGGPVTEENTGRVAAIVNAGNEEKPHDSWGRAIADTYLCGRA